MINHWIVPCRKAVIDAETNIVSLLEIIEELRIPTPPPEAAIPFAIPIELSVMGYWEREAGDGEGYEGRLLLIGPNGEVLGEGGAALDFHGRDRLRTRTNFVGFPVAGQGRYLIRCESRPSAAEPWTVERTAPILVVYT